jgi:hypothetical protein
MSYWANPFDTTAGLMVQQNVYESLFLEGGKTGFRSREHTSHFERAFFQGRGADMIGVTALRCLTLVYDDYDKAMSGDSGIYCCGECGRIDHLWNWEFVDFGFYSSFDKRDQAWITGEYNPKKMTTGIYSGSGYGIIAQVRCNEVSSCTHCGTTVQAPIADITNCPECGRGPAASDPDNLGMIQAGCGSMGSVFHSVPPVTSDQVYTISAEIGSQSPRVNFVTLVAAKSLTVKVPRTITPNTMRIEWAGDNSNYNNRQGQLVMDKRQAMTWVPNLVMTLPVDASERGGASNPLRFPISMFGGFSNQESPLYPGMTAFGGSQVTQFKRGGGSDYDFYMTGYRSPTDSSSGDQRSWVNVGDIAGYVNTNRTQSRVKLAPLNGDTSRNNRPYHLTQFYVQDGDGPRAGGQYRGGVVRVENYAGSGRSPAERVRTYTDRLPVMRFRTEQPNSAGKLVDGVEVGFRGKPGIKYVNLLNPGIRDIDDNGMIRVAAQTIKPIPDVPSILEDTNPPIPGIGLVCPNDVVAALEYYFYATDVKDGLAARLREAVRKWAEQTAASGADPTGYPWGVSNIGNITDPNIKQTLDDFGLTTPADAPGSFYSYIITLQKARAVAKIGNRFHPAFNVRRRLPIAYAGSLEPADMFGYTDPVEEVLFYANHGGSGNRRDGNIVPPTRYPRFGSVVPNAELVEDPLHPTGFDIPPPNCTITHDVTTIAKGTSINVDDQEVFKTHFCETCMGTNAGPLRGTIVNQFQNAITDLVVDPYGWPVTWRHIPNNRLGLEDWMIACHVAYEDNRIFQICPDPIVTITPAADPTDPPNTDYDPYVKIPDPSGIADFRTGEKFSFVPLSAAQVMPGYVSHDVPTSSSPGLLRWSDPSGGADIEEPFPQPRSDYLMSAHGDFSNYSPLLNMGNGLLRRLAPTGPFYRDTGSGTHSPIMFGIMLDGKKYTSGASGLAATGGSGGVP